jgi:membrane protein
VFLRVPGDLVRATRRFVEDRGLVLASALAYSFVLCLPSLALLFSSGIGFLLASEAIAGEVLAIATALLPGYNREVLNAVGLLTRERRVTGLVGGGMLALFATQLFSLTRLVLNVAFRVSKRRGLVHGLVFDLVALVTIGLLVLTLAAATLVLLTLATVGPDGGPGPAVPPWVQATVRILLYVTLLALFFLAYRTFPNTAVSSRAAVLAALAAGALWEAARWGFGAYLARFGPYGRLYGPFAAIVASLAWIYLSAAIFIWGAELAAVLTERVHGTVDTSTKHDDGA